MHLKPCNHYIFSVVPAQVSLHRKHVAINWAPHISPPHISPPHISPPHISPPHTFLLRKLDNANYRRTLRHERRSQVFAQTIQTVDSPSRGHSLVDSLTLSLFAKYGPHFETDMNIPEEIIAQKNMNLTNWAFRWFWGCHLWMRSWQWLEAFSGYYT